MLASAASVGPRRSGRAASASNCSSITSAASFTRPSVAEHAGQQHRRLEAPLDRDLARQRLAQVRDRRARVELALGARRGRAGRRRGAPAAAARPARAADTSRRRRPRRARAAWRAAADEPLERPRIAARRAAQQLRRDPLGRLAPPRPAAAPRGRARARAPPDPCPAYTAAPISGCRNASGCALRSTPAATSASAASAAASDRPRPAPPPGAAARRRRAPPRPAPATARRRQRRQPRRDLARDPLRALLGHALGGDGAVGHRARELVQQERVAAGRRVAGAAQRVVGAGHDRADHAPRRRPRPAAPRRERCLRAPGTASRLATISATGSPATRFAMCAITPSDAASAQCASSTNSASGRSAARFAVSQYSACRAANGSSGGRRRDALEFDADQRGGESRRPRERVRSTPRARTAAARPRRRTPARARHPGP